MKHWNICALPKTTPDQRRPDHLASWFCLGLMHVYYYSLGVGCGTLKCENASVCEKVAKCEKYQC